MNITVLTADGKVVVRPDTTRVKDEEEVWLPEDTERIFWAPVIYSRLTKSGKCIAGKFAGRYFSQAGIGLLFYPLQGDSPEDYAHSLCIDRTSALKLQFNPLEKGEMTLTIDGKESFRASFDIAKVLSEALEKASRHTLQRLGDIIAVELCSPVELESRNSRQRFCGYSGNEMKFETNVNI